MLPTNLKEKILFVFLESILGSKNDILECLKVYWFLFLVEKESICRKNEGKNVFRLIEANVSSECNVNNEFTNRKCRSLILILIHLLPKNLYSDRDLSITLLNKCTANCFYPSFQCTGCSIAHRVIQPNERPTIVVTKSYERGGRLGMDGIYPNERCSSSIQQRLKCTDPVILRCANPTFSFINITISITTKTLKISYSNSQQPSLTQSTIVCTQTFFKTFRSGRSFAAVLRALMLCSGDVEVNPGPAPTTGLGAGTGLRKDEQRTQARNVSSILVKTFNVRGLKDEKKLRHLINNCTASMKSAKDAIFFLQETYIDEPGKIPYLWRGNFHLTPGIGHSQGCVTLLSNHIQVIECRNILNRAHVLVCQNIGDNKPTYILANLYAPCPNVQEKIDFFDTTLASVDELSLKYECRKIIVGGDLNLNFKVSEVKNRHYTSQEKNIARVVKEMIGNLELCDIWEESHLFTWNRANTNIFSTIDRVLYSNEMFKIESVSTDWGLSASDHAAVVVKMNPIDHQQRGRDKLVRLDPLLLKDNEILRMFEVELEEMLQSVGDDWNPHLKLEFLKMSIRSLSERAQANRKKKERSEEEDINEELNQAVSALENDHDVDVADLIDYIEELRARKKLLLEKKGERLAERLKTKWYNEGEKSNRYFLRLLNRPTIDDFKELRGPDGLINDQEKIEKEIIRFYKGLYEDFDVNNLRPEETEDFLRLIEPIDNNLASGVSCRLGKDELAATLADCKDSAPGPDGIPYSYYRSLWRLAGPIIVDAWNYTLETGNLAPSHKISYLKLIPKSGKDLSLLTNWRPITLSNCDHKLITKTYARRLGNAVNAAIEANQTAYLKGRLINENVRSMIATINITTEEDLEGLIVSLDAKKAFDSVQHDYIIKCLNKLGLESFVPIFKILYKDLSSDILINGKICKGYRILRGVKQGDALSCILFIICMEPLLRNIEANDNIEPIISRELGRLPKAYAYADDVNATVKNNLSTLQSIFDEYAKLTRVSGLELNADKTEIMRLSRAELRVPHRPTNFVIDYLGCAYDLRTLQEIKVNGVYLQQSTKKVVDANVDKALERVNKVFRHWSARSFSTLGKILIAKTFGISQITFLIQSIVLEEQHFKKINHILYKFIWNKHFTASKAPERVKREIVTVPIKLGGYGMLDVAELDTAIKIKSLGRLVESNHPFLKLIKLKIDFENYFHLRLRCTYEPLASFGCKKLAEKRLANLRNIEGDISTNMLKVARNTRIVEFLNVNGKNSLAFLNLRTSGKTRIRDLTMADLDSIGRFIENDLVGKLRLAASLRMANENVDQNYYMGIENRHRLIDLRKATSKIIREMSGDKKRPITSFKLGASIPVAVALNWGNALSKVTSVRHRNCLLRVAHGDIYTKEKLARYGLRESPNCPRCGEIEDLQHKITQCEYSRRIWERTTSLTDRLKLSDTIDPIPIENKILGATVGTNPLILAIHSEVLSRILTIKDDANYLLRPKVLVKQALKTIQLNEKNLEIKSKCESLLDALEY